MLLECVFGEYFVICIFLHRRALHQVARGGFAKAANTRTSKLTYVISDLGRLSDTKKNEGKGVQDLAATRKRNLRK